MKKRYKILIIITLVVTLVLIISNITLATTIKDLDAPASDAFKDSGTAIVSVLSTIGIVISVIMLAALGVKYMLGSVEERAEYRKSFIPYLVGAGLVFGASTIAQIVYLFAK